MMLATRPRSASVAGGLDSDHAALAAACEYGGGLCTLVNIEGSFSRRLGAQLAIGPDGSTVGSLSDGCLEAQLAADLRDLRAPRVVRYGHGSANIDFRLPCGSGLDILLDPDPCRDSLRKAMSDLRHRRSAQVALPACSTMAARQYLPGLRLRAFGEGPELAALQRLALAADIPIEPVDKARLTLGRGSGLAPVDRWTAVVLLFHDHEWEIPLIAEALAGPAFYIGAQGGEKAREDRVARLLSEGVAEEDIARLQSPVGAVPACKTPDSLALSVLAEIAGRYEGLHDAA